MKKVTIIRAFALYPLRLLAATAIAVASVTLAAVTAVVTLAVYAVDPLRAVDDILRVTGDQAGPTQDFLIRHRARLAEEIGG